MATNGQSAGLTTADWTEGELAALETVEDFLPEQVREGTVLRATDVHKRFGGVQALRGASIEVPAHSFVGLIGPNGSGKSTLFDVLNGFTTPDQGTVEAFGQDVTRKHAWDRAKLGMSRTFQANHIDLDLTVLDNLLAGAYLNVRGGVLASVLGFPAVRADQRKANGVARAVARLLDLEPVLEVRAGSLNFGAQRRIEIGRSLMSRLRPPAGPLRHQLQHRPRRAGGRARPQRRREVDAAQDDPGRRAGHQGDGGVRPDPGDARAAERPLPARHRPVARGPADLQEPEREGEPHHRLVGHRQRRRRPPHGEDLRPVPDSRPARGPAGRV